MTVIEALRPTGVTGVCRHCGLTTRLAAFVRTVTGRWPACLPDHEHEPA